jgi:hypothetical protein
VKAKTSEGKWSDSSEEVNYGSEGEIQARTKYRETSIYRKLYIPLSASGIYKKIGGEKRKK